MVGALAAVVVWLLWQLRLVLLPVLVALLLCTVLVPLVARLEARGWPTLGATWTVFGGGLLVVLGVAALVVPPTVDELSDIGPSVQEGAADVEDWLVDGPLGLDRERVHEFTGDPVGAVGDMVRSSDVSLADSAMVAGEALAGALLALVLSFLFLKDGRRFQAWALRRAPARHRDTLRATAQRAWEALTQYLRGAAILGGVEGVIIGGTVAAVGGSLAVPIGVLTFAAAFFPIVGAVVAGGVAVLVVLATAGLVPALIVLAVAVVVQQLDNDLLAPFIYGHQLQLHPAVILIAITGGGLLGGIVGAFIAVPVVAVVSAVAGELWPAPGDEDDAPGGTTRAGGSPTS